MRVLIPLLLVATATLAQTVTLPAVGKVMYEFSKNYIDMVTSAPLINEIQSFEGSSNWADCNAMCSSLLYGGTPCNFFYLDAGVCKVCYVADRMALTQITKADLPNYDGSKEVRILNVQKAVVDP